MSTTRGVIGLIFSSQLLCVFLALLGVSGCQFISTSYDPESTAVSKRNVLPPMQASRDALKLDMVMIDRRADDPLIGSQLWEYVDQVGAIPPETRELLRENGCQVGHVAATPPIALLKLLGVASEIDGVDAKKSGVMLPQVRGHTYSLQSGTETEIQTSESLPDCDVRVIDADQTRQLHLGQTRCIFRVTPIRMQDGWVRVEFLPELHYGDMKLRHVPTDELGWSMKSAQKVEQCYSQRFAVTLNVGESAIITAIPTSESDSEESLGERFFRRDEDGQIRQRLLVVRLVDMGSVNKILE